MYWPVKGSTFEVALKNAVFGNAGLDELATLYNPFYSMLKEIHPELSRRFISEKFFLLPFKDLEGGIQGDMWNPLVFDLAAGGINPFDKDASKIIIGRNGSVKTFLGVNT